MPKRLASWCAWGSALAFFLTGLFPLFNADAYGHLAQGRQILWLGRVPKVDLFSIWKPEPQPWNNYEWAYDAATWWIYDRLGANALILLKCLALAALGYLLVVLAMRLARGAELAAPFTLAALLLVLPVARFRFTLRPQILGLLFPAVLLLGIAKVYEESVSSRSKAWVLGSLGVLHVVWVNAHGSHLFGIAITSVFAVMSIRTSAFRWMVGLLGLQVVATGCTPFGFAIATDAISHLLRPEYRALLVEWAPWSPKDPLRLLVAPIVTASFVLLSLRPVARSSRFGLAYAVLCVLLSLMAFRSLRFEAHQLLFCAPFIAAGLAQLPVLRHARRSVAALVAVAAVACGVWTAQLVPSLGFGFGEPKREYPWASAELIVAHVDTPRVLASIQDSWVLMFAAPNARLLVDGRVPFYGPEMIGRVLQSFSNPRGFASLLSEYDINTVVLDSTRRDHVPATEHMRARDDWALAFVEDGHSLYVRRDVSASIQPLQIVAPGYRAGKLLDSELDEDAVRAEVGRIGSQANTATIHAWHEGLALLRPLARDGDRAGIRKYRSSEERRRARAAYERLAVVANSLPGFTTVELFRSMAAASACDVPQARLALARATHREQTRGTTLAGIELALRSGETTERAAAIAHLQRLKTHPESRDDPWVAAIANDIDVRCP